MEDPPGFTATLGFGLMLGGVKEPPGFSAELGFGLILGPIKGAELGFGLMLGSIKGAKLGFGLMFGAIIGAGAGLWLTISKLELNSHDLMMCISEHLPVPAEIPKFTNSAATGNASALHSIYSWSFSSTLEVNGISPGILAPGPTSNSSSSINKNGTNNSSKNKAGLVIGLTIGGLVLAGGSGLFIFTVRKKTRMLGQDDSNSDVEISDEFESGHGPKKFLYSELARVTGYFSQEGKLGEGGFGGVYKGYLREINSYVAVKRVSGRSQQGIKEYTSEVKIISRLRHRNLVQLLGWCHEKKELLLVYEFMPNRSLDFHLFKRENSLTWSIRFKIVQGLACAILYLHEEWEQCVVHRDINSSNVMLDSGFNAKLGDFGHARLVDHDKGSQTTVLARTMGYMAPECVTTGRASKESDVYSFDVVTLEIACGRKPINPKSQESQVNLVEWVWRLYGTGKLLKASQC